MKVKLGMKVKVGRWVDVVGNMNVKVGMKVKLGRKVFTVIWGEK